MDQYSCIPHVRPAPGVTSKANHDLQIPSESLQLSCFCLPREDSPSFPQVGSEGIELAPPTCEAVLIDDGGKTGRVSA